MICLGPAASTQPSGIRHVHEASREGRGRNRVPARQHTQRANWRTMTGQLLRRYSAQ